MGSVVCGFLAILSSFEGELITASWLVVLAGFLDGMDGKIARLSRASSRFGVELDSLADFLSFGVAPAVIVYVAVLQSMGRWGWLISIVYIMGASYRLARFNLLATIEEKKGFLGLPVPGAALTLVTYLIFSDQVWGYLAYGNYLYTMMILFSALMVSQLEYEAIPDQFYSRGSRIKLLILLVGGAAALIYPRLLLFPIFALYVIIGLVRAAYKYIFIGVGIVKNGKLGKRKIKKAEKIDEQQKGDGIR